MEKKRPQLNLAELHQLKWLLGGVLALLSAWTVLYMDVQAWLWLVLITVTAPIVIRWPALTLKVPRLVHRLAFPLFVALFAADFYLNREPLPAMIRLALMLVLYRVVTPRKRRDDLQLIVLGLFLVVVAGVLSVSLVFALQIVVFTGCALMFLLAITLIDSVETSQTSNGPSAPSVADQKTPAWMRIEWLRLARRLREANDWRVTTLVLGLFGGVVGLSALLFFALPRFELSNSFFLDNMVSRKTKTGFSENIRFGDVTDIQNDTSVALRVESSDVRAIPSDPYWRMLVLDVYENGMFSLSPELEDRLRSQKRKAARVAGSSRPRMGDAVWTFYLEGGTSRFLPLLGSFNYAQFNDGPQAYSIDDETRMLRLERAPAKMFAYRIEGMRYEPAMGAVEVNQKRDPVPRTQDQAFERGDAEAPALPPPTFLKLGLAAEEAAKVEGWVQALKAPTGDVDAFARLASAWLAQNHRYSLHSVNEGPGDPLVNWLGSSQPGHCELFAGGFLLLARTAGYPARLVTGFRGGSWNSGGYLSIRNSDAHAWCEIFDAGKQVWVRVDPTPGASLPGEVAASESVEAALERIRDFSWSARLDGVRMFWYRRIVDFDQSSQAELARGAKHAIESQAKKLKTWINGRLEAIGAWLQEPWDVARLAAWVFVIVTAFGVVLGWRNYGRGLWLRWRSGLTRSGADPVRCEAGRWLRKLEAQGDGNAEVRTELERLRYGPRSSWPNPQPIFRKAKRVASRKRVQAGQDGGPGSL